MPSRRTLATVAFRAVLLVGFVAGRLATAEENVAPLGNWTAPPFWSGDVASARDAGHERGASSRAAEGRTALTSGPTALPFIALPPCRLVDTRAPAFPAPLGGGFLPPATVRSYTLTGVCGLPANAQAVSLNVTVVHPTGPGFITLYPEGGAFPPVSTLNYLGNDVVVNAAVVPLSVSGGISMALGVSGGDVILDTNGYYAVADVASLNGLVGNVSLAAGANVSLTPSGNTLTVAASGGPGGSLPTGIANQTLYNTGSAWAASSALTNDGTNVTISGTLAFPFSPQITSGGAIFLGAVGFANTLLGLAAGSSITSGVNNTFMGFNAGLANTTGQNNTFLGTSAGASNSTNSFSTAVGFHALWTRTAGDNDVAVGGIAMATGAGVPSGGSNVAVGHAAYVSGPSGTANTAVGANALASATSGDHNTAIGGGALVSATSGDNNAGIGSRSFWILTSGSNNTALGTYAGQNLTSGSGNLYLASSGAATESNVTRIGETQTQAFIAGVRGVTTGSATGIAVLIDANGQLGTVSSSATVKDDIRDIADESAKLMRLRPVTFRYKAHGPDGPKQYGLIAEEVDEVMPELVARSKDGEIETVMYHELPALLLNELQRLERRIAELERQLQARGDGR